MTADDRTATPMDRAGAQRFCQDLAITMDGLAAVLDEEARLLREARFGEAFAVGERKSELADAYFRAHETMRASSREISRLAPVELDQLRRRHEVLQEKLGLSMAVLSTARAVSESLIRGVADEVHGRDRHADTYTADARRSGGPAGARPLSLNVAL